MLRLHKESKKGVRFSDLSLFSFNTYRYPSESFHQYFVYKKSKYKSGNERQHCTDHFVIDKKVYPHFLLT